MESLVPGTVAFYLPECLQRFGLDLQGWGILVTAWKSALACWLLWHAIQLSDRETRTSRLHVSALPAPGYLHRFLASTGLFWGVLMLGLWPSARLLSGSWDPRLLGQAAWALKPSGWQPSEAGALALAALAAVPAGLWTVFGWFHGYYVADSGQGAWESMRSSALAVQGAFWRCVLFLAVIGGLNALGLALWVVGIFVAFPVTLMATTYIHLDLKRQTPALAKPKPLPKKARGSRG
ncbi:MAG TPA: hypothetical protein VNZ54_06205 [bacterium]|jgi:hypothetical protein|nr:hypothetical protein [bacterium]HXC65053.1 hypothetical protein [bacterium]